jgi:bacterioferritin (cytochrome b1)
MPLRDDELFLLSYYRTSEINGSLFFGRLARTVRSGPIQHDLSKHFADEAQHAWYWTRCIDRLGARPIPMASGYQDQYLEAAGLPVNLMEVLAITLVFEQRVINQYSRHLKLSGLDPEIADTFGHIMADERWHLKWVRDALVGMESRYGKEHIAATIARNRAADGEVYAKTLAEYEARLSFLFGQRTFGQPTEES